MITKSSKNDMRKRRHARVRKRLAGTQTRPRLNVYRSNKHIYAQLIDDDKGTTLASASTLDNELDVSSTGKVEAAAKVSDTEMGEAAAKVHELIAKRGQDKGYNTVFSDRGDYLYHVRVKALAEAAKEAGLEF